MINSPYLLSGENKTHYQSQMIPGDYVSITSLPKSSNRGHAGEMSALRNPQRNLTPGTVHSSSTSAVQKSAEIFPSHQGARDVPEAITVKKGRLA